MLEAVVADFFPEGWRAEGRGDFFLLESPGRFWRGRLRQDARIDFGTMVVMPSAGLNSAKIGSIGRSISPV